MGETNNKSKKVLYVALTIIVIILLGFFSYGYRSTIKKFFGFATVYDAVADRARLPENNWKIQSNSFAWGESIGWIDFAPSGVQNYVADNALWGYAYGENIGWISLNCHNTEESCTNSYGVLNDGEGNLSGFAWGENIGWIDFGAASPATYQVKINADGTFSGFAWGENVGWISFATGTSVTTNWRPQSTRAVCNNGLDDDEDGLIDLADDGCLNNLSGTSEIKSKPRTQTAASVVIEFPNGGESLLVGDQYDIKIKTLNLPKDAIIYVDIEDSTGSTTRLTMANRDIANTGLIKVDVPANLKDGEYKVKAFCMVKDAKTGVESYCSTDGTLTTNQLAQDISDDYFMVSYPKDDTKLKAIEMKKLEETTNNTKTSTTTSSSSTTSGHTRPGDDLTPINTIEIPVIIPEKIVLKDLPTFSGDKGFTFVPQLTSFVLSPLPKELSKTLDKSAEFKKYLESLGFSREQDLVRLDRRPILLIQKYPIPAGLFIVKNDTNTLRTYLTLSDSKELVQSVRIASGTPITISLIPTSIKGAVVAKWNDQTIPFTKNGEYMTIDFSSGTPGKYILNTEASPVPLMIDVLPPTVATQESTSPKDSGWLGGVLKWFGR